MAQAFLPAERWEQAGVPVLARGNPQNSLADAKIPRRVVGPH
ncbi:hypothetical protein SBA2_10088 [Acidobacteriia bacterium SbA2]|nr:hypothetical protein SBA2_10088 [Acidobacteriia bacterium SbA2]